MVVRRTRTKRRVKRIRKIKRIKKVKRIRRRKKLFVIHKPMFRKKSKIKWGIPFLD